MSFVPISLKPRMSEKTYSASQKLNVYTFDVPATANKHIVAASVATQYSVTVEEVRIANIKGKAKKSYRKGGRKAQEGQRNDIKKAYVTLKEGDNLPIFAGVEADTHDQKESK